MYSGDAPCLRLSDFPKNIERRLDAIARKTGRTKAF
jgi:hypothetical protein